MVDTTFADKGGITVYFFKAVMQLNSTIKCAFKPRGSGEVNNESATHRYYSSSQSNRQGVPTPQPPPFSLQYISTVVSIFKFEISTSQIFNLEERSRYFLEYSFQLACERGESHYLFSLVGFFLLPSTRFILPC